MSNLAGAGRRRVKLQIIMDFKKQWNGMLQPISQELNSQLVEWNKSKGLFQNQAAVAEDFHSLA